MPSHSVNTQQLREHQLKGRVNGVFRWRARSLTQTARYSAIMRIVGVCSRLKDSIRGMENILVMYLINMNKE